MIFTLLCIKEFVKNFPFVNKNNPIKEDPKEDQIEDTKEKAPIETQIEAPIEDHTEGP